MHRPIPISMHVYSYSCGLTILDSRSKKRCTSQGEREEDAMSGTLTQIKERAPGPERSSGDNCINMKPIARRLYEKRKKGVGGGTYMYIHMFSIIDRSTIVGT